MTSILSPLGVYNASILCQEIAQTVVSVSSEVDGVLFWLSRKIMPNIPPFSTLPLLPYALFDHTIAVIPGILTTTLVGMIAWETTTSTILRGAICGIHAQAMMIFAYSPPFLFGLDLPYSVNGAMRNLFLNNDRLTRLELNQLRLIECQAGIIAGIVLTISSVALTALSQNPIVANAIAYPTAALTKIVAMRLLSELSLAAL